MKSNNRNDAMQSDGYELLKYFPPKFHIPFSACSFKQTKNCAHNSTHSQFDDISFHSSKLDIYLDNDFDRTHSEQNKTTTTKKENSSPQSIVHFII